jgi:hypothetical protein
LFGSGRGHVTGSCECGKESKGSIKRGEFLDWMRTISFSSRTLLQGLGYETAVDEKHSNIQVFK